MAGIQTSPAPLGALPTTTAGLASQANYQPAPNQGGRLEQANAGYAVGGLFDAYQKAQVDQTNQASALSKAARDRLTQIWQAGAADPNLQNNPKVHKQISALWQQMTGAGFPVTPGQAFSWDTIAPPKSINDLTPQVLQQLREAQPADRRAMAKGMHLLDADEGFLNAPALISQAGLSAFRTQYAKMIEQGGAKGMTPEAFKNFVSTNRNAFAQAFDDPNAADNTLNDPDIFAGIKQNQVAYLQKLQAAAQLSTTKTGVLTGDIIPPKDAAQIQEYLAQAQNASSLAGLHNIQGRFQQAKLDNYPAEFKDRMALIEQQTKTSVETANHLRELVQTAKTTGKDSPYGQAVLAVNDAQKQYDAALGAFKTAQASGLGIPPETLDALTLADKNLKTMQASRDEAASPAFKAAMAAARATSTTGVPTTPTKTDPNTKFTPPAGAVFSPDGKRYWDKTDGKIHDKDTGKLSANQNP